MTPHSWEKVPTDPEYHSVLPPVPEWRCRRCGSAVSTFRHMPSHEDFESRAWDGRGARLSADCDEMLTKNLLES